VDEVLAVGDQAFQEKCMQKFADFRRSGKTVVIVSHAMGSMRALCDSAAWLKSGHLVEIGPANSVVDTYIDEGHIDRIVGESGTQWGSGEARVTSVELIDTTGANTGRIRTGDPLTFRIHYRTTERVERPVFGLSLDTIEGVFVWAQQSRDGGYVPDAIEGEGTVDLVVPALALQAGAYDLNVSITDYSTTHIYDDQRPCGRLDVLASDHLRESGGFASLGGQWGNLQAQGGSQPAEQRA